MLWLLPLVLLLIVLTIGLIVLASQVVGQRWKDEAMIGCGSSPNILFSEQGKELITDGQRRRGF